MMKKLQTMPAWAKINWSLEIIGRRPDGYHLIRSLMQQVTIADQVRIASSSLDACTCGALPEEENLAFQAWQRLKQRLSLSECLDIQIEKHIPVGAGLAGGSSDGAAVLLGAARLLNLTISRQELWEIGLSLGADVPFCLQGGASLVEGVGEVLTPLRQPPSCWLVLANPGFPVSTSQVYQAYDRWGSDAMPNVAEVQKVLEQGHPELACCFWGNHLQAGACRLYPELKKVERAFRILDLEPIMSGSGGTFFAVCRTSDQAEAAAMELKKTLPWAVAAHTETSNWEDKEIVYGA